MEEAAVWLTFGSPFGLLAVLWLLLDFLLLGSCSLVVASFEGWLAQFNVGLEEEFFSTRVYVVMRRRG